MKKIKSINELKSAKIAVVFGGISKERPGSQVSGKTAYYSLKKQGYNVFPIDPKTDNVYEKMKKADIVFLVLHGRYGEDGKIQGFLETLQIPYCGSGVLASSIGMDKQIFKRLLISENIPTPEYEVFNLKNDHEKEAERIIKHLSLPLFLKPISEGGSLGASIIKSAKQMIETIRYNVEAGFDNYIVEKYIDGKAITIGLLERKNGLTCLPILDTISKKEFYDYEAKHDANLHIYICPAKLQKKIYSQIESVALKVHRLLGCHGYSRVDFIINKQGKSFVLEVNTLPGLSSQSNMATMAKAAGISYDQLVAEMLKTVVTKPDYLP